MGIRSLSFAVQSPMHPSNLGQASILWIAPQNLTYFINAVAINSLPAAGGSTVPTVEWMPGTGQSLVLTPSAAITLTLNIYGEDHLGRAVSEQIVFTASAAAQFSRMVYKRVFRFEIVSKSASANTLSVGFDPVNGSRIGIPIAPAEAIPMAAPSVLTGNNYEIVAFINQNGAVMTIAADAAGDPAFDRRYSSVKAGGTWDAGPIFVLAHYKVQGGRTS